MVYQHNITLNFNYIEGGQTTIDDATLWYFDGATYYIKFTQEGSKDKYSVIDSTINEWYWGNILFGGIIGFMIFDPATGAIWKLPKYINDQP